MTDKEEKTDINKEEIKKEPEIDTDPGDDFVFEENTEVTGPDCKQKMDKLKAKIKELENKNAELLDNWQRERADSINFKKREEESRKEFMKFAKTDIIAELLVVLDSFESAFKNKEAWEKADKNWRMGVEYIHTQFLNILTQNGLEVINPIGQMYDHSRDEAVDNVKVEKEEEDNKIIEVVRIGYTLHGKEIRAPKVRVGHYE